MGIASVSSKHPISIPAEARRSLNLCKADRLSFEPSEDARFVFQSGADTRLAFERSSIQGDLPEHLIALAARRSGNAKTQTFDQAVERFPEFEVLRG